MRAHDQKLALFAGLLIAFVFLFAESHKAYADTTTTVENATATQCNITTSAGCRLSTGAIISTPVTLSISDDACGSTTGCYDAARSDHGQAQVPINVWGECRYIDNNSPSSNPLSVFIPFRTQQEWQAFNNNAPSYLTIWHCSVPFPSTNASTISIPAPPYPGSGCTESFSEPVPGFYTRYSSNNFDVVSEPSLSYTSCNSGATHIGATVVWDGLDSDTNSPSWKLLVNYGPDFTLNASATIRNNQRVSGNFINVLYGTPVTFSWGSTSASSNLPSSINVGTSPAIATPVTLNPTVAQSAQASWTSETAGSGSVTLTPSSTTTYSMTGTGGNNVSSVASVTVSVEMPISMSMSVNPGTINTGSSTTLSWSISNPSNAAVTCTASGGWSGTIPASNGSRSISPTSNTTYWLTCADAVQSVQASASVVVCPSGYMDWNNNCTVISYTATYGGESCPTACNTAASSLSPSGCIRNPDGASVPVSYCGGQSEYCAATSACPKPCTTTITSSLTRPSIDEPITVNYTMSGGGGGAAGPFSGRGGNGGTSAIVVNGNVVAAASGGAGAQDPGNDNVGTAGQSGQTVSGSFVLNPSDTLAVYVGGGGGAGADFGTTGSGDGGGGAGWPGGNATGGAGGYGYGGNGAASPYTGAGGGAGGSGGAGGGGGGGASSAGYYGDGGAGGGGGGGYGGGGGGAGCSDIYGFEGYGNPGGVGGSTGNSGGVGTTFGGSCTGGAGGGGGASGGGGGAAWGYGGNGGLVTLTYLAVQCL